MKSQRATDVLLAGSVGGGLFFPPLLAGVFAAALLRDRPFQIRWRLHHAFMLGATSWAILVLAFFRQAQFSGLTYFSYIWTLPVVFAIYKPDRSTTEIFGRLIAGLFILDLFFNCYSMTTGGDLLGRTLDNRDGLVVSARNGGLFAHSFYSGSISIAALIFFLDRSRPTFPAILSLFNLAAAGSWRLVMAAIIVLIAALLWCRWNRIGSAIFIAACSIAIVIGVVLTSGALPIDLEPNLSNTNRLYAWLLSIDKLQGSELFGVGLPVTNGLEAVNFETIDENLIAESWYLGTAIAFGFPYTILSFLVFASAYFGENFDKGNRQFSLLMPLVFIDMVAGEFFMGILIYTWLWLLIAAVDARSSTSAIARAA